MYIACISDCSSYKIAVLEYRFVEPVVKDETVHVPKSVKELVDLYENIATDSSSVCSTASSETNHQVLHGKFEPNIYTLSEGPIAYDVQNATQVEDIEERSSVFHLLENQKALILSGLAGLEATKQCILAELISLQNINTTSRLNGQVDVTKELSKNLYRGPNDDSMHKGNENKSNINSSECEAIYLQILQEENDFLIENAAAMDKRISKLKQEKQELLTELLSSFDCNDNIHGNE